MSADLFTAAAERSALVSGRSYSQELAEIRHPDACATGLGLFCLGAGYCAGCDSCDPQEPEL